MQKNALYIPQAVAGFRRAMLEIQQTPESPVDPPVTSMSHPCHIPQPPSSPCPSYQSNRSHPKSETKNAQRILRGWRQVSSGRAASCPAANPDFSHWQKLHETPANLFEQIILSPLE